VSGGGIAHDFDGNGKSDIAWRNTSDGGTSLWLMNGSTISSSGGFGVVYPVMRAVSDMIEMSAIIATARPAPTATPLMAETIGLSRLIML